MLLTCRKSISVEYKEKEGGYTFAKVRLGCLDLDLEQCSGQILYKDLLCSPLFSRRSDCPGGNYNNTDYLDI